MEAAGIYEEAPQKGEDQEVVRWFNEIELALKTEKNWRKDAEKCLAIYANEEGRKEDGSCKETFNILWSNVEIKAQALYSALPRPDIRRRHRDRDPVGKAVSELLERCTTYTLDCQGVHDALKNSVNTMLLPGRAVVRVGKKTEFVKGEDGSDTDEIAHEEVLISFVQWDKYIRGPGKTWEEIPWEGWIHEMTKDEVKDRWPTFADKISYDIQAFQAEDGKKQDEASVFKKATIYEIWDKDSKKVHWLAKGYKDALLESVEDPLDLDNFWPNPRPLYAIENSTTMVPATEYSMYSILARELEKITRRRNKIADAIKVRGVYDSTMPEVERVLQEDDNGLVPAENLSALIERGGLDKAIWMLPIDVLTNAYMVLGQQRQELIGQIYEITGISDIIRGDTQASETATAQKIKANFGSLRLERQKSEVARFARDLVRLIAEVIADFDRATLSAMSGLQFPTMADRMMAQQQIQMLQMQAQQLQSAGMGQPMNMMAPGQSPEQTQQQVQKIQQQIQQLQAQPALTGPVWEEIEEVLHSDLLREYKVDIETDSTVAVDAQKDQQVLSEFMNGMGNFTRYAGEAMQTGLLTPPAAKAMMVAFARKFKLGREVENELEQQEPPKENPAQQAQAAEAQMEQQRQAFEMQKEREKWDREREKMAMERQLEAEKAAAERARLEAEMAKMQSELAIERERAGIERMRLLSKESVDQAQHARKMEQLEHGSQKPDNG